MVRVRCCQTNKVYRVAVSELGRKDELPLDDADLRKGAALLWACGSHSYQVTVVDVTSKGTGMFATRYIEWLCQSWEGRMSYR